MIHVSIIKDGETVVDQDTDVVLYSLNTMDGESTLAGACLTRGESDIVTFMAAICAVIESAMKSVNKIFDTPPFGEIVREAVELAQSDSGRA